MLKGQDIAVLIKLLLKQSSKEKIEFKSIAYELYISQSEVTKSIRRLEKSRLLIRYSDERLELNKHALEELFIYAVKYLFPAEINIATRGMAAAYSSPGIKTQILSEDTYVWPYIHGHIKGLALTPIYKTLPDALDRTADNDFYEIISALDIIRLGGRRENKIAKEILEKYIWNQQE